MDEEKQQNWCFNGVVLVAPLFCQPHVMSYSTIVKNGVATFDLKALVMAFLVPPCKGNFPE
jgi:hypothetical protein